MRLQGMGLALLFLVTLHSCSPFKLIERHTRKKLRKAGLGYHTLDAEDYTFSYWDSGAEDKPVYVLFHGFGSSTHLHWYKQAKALAKTHRLILPNLLYHGSEPKGQRGYGTQDQVNAMSSLLEKLDVDSMVLGGISYGGLIAAELGMHNKSKVQKLTLFSSPVKFFTEADLEDVKARADVKDLYELMVPADIEMMRKLGNIALYKDRKIPRFIVKDIQQNLFQDEQRNRDFKALLDVVLIDKEVLLNRTYTFDCPVLLVWGAEDELFPARVGQELNTYLPTSELHLIPKAGHGPNIEKSKQFNDILLNFLN
ncbi:MAG: alpha/beta hydrolase [Bacteroidota bacterium]